MLILIGHQSLLSQSWQLARAVSLGVQNGAVLSVVKCTPAEMAERQSRWASHRQSHGCPENRVEKEEGTIKRVRIWQGRSPTPGTSSSPSPSPPPPPPNRGTASLGSCPFTSPSTCPGQQVSGQSWCRPRRF
jgi:hypothetical protein